MGDKYRKKHELVTRQKLKSVQGLVTNSRLISPNGHKQRNERGLKSSCRAACWPWVGPGSGVGTFQEGCRTQWGRLECLLLLSPPPAALSLEKPLKSRARL